MKSLSKDALVAFLQGALVLMPVLVPAENIACVLRGSSASDRLRGGERRIGRLQSGSAVGGLARPHLVR